MNEARLRMTRIPEGADLILNKVSGAPGFWIGNVIVLAGVPSIMQAMLDEVAPKLNIGVRMLSETVREANGGLNLRWIETGGPTVESPTRRGFGGRVIEQMIAQLKGESRFDWYAEGLVCEITLRV